MIDKDFAQRFAQEWIESWNSHDLDRILSHYSEDFVFSSPYIAKVTGDPAGRVQGKDQARVYWRRGLALVPDLRFELLGVFIGVDSILIHYRGIRGVLSAEVFRFGPDWKVTASSAHYA